MSRPFGKFVVNHVAREREGVKCTHCIRIVNVVPYDGRVKRAVCTFCYSEGKR